MAGFHPLVCKKNAAPKGAAFFIDFEDTNQWPVFVSIRIP